MYESTDPDSARVSGRDLYHCFWKMVLCDKKASWFHVDWGAIALLGKGISHLSRYQPDYDRMFLLLKMAIDFLGDLLLSVRATEMRVLEGGEKAMRREPRYAIASLPQFTR